MTFAPIPRDKVRYDHEREARPQPKAANGVAQVLEEEFDPPANRFEVMFGIGARTVDGRFDNGTSASVCLADSACASAIRVLAMECLRDPIRRARRWLKVRPNRPPSQE